MNVFSACANGLIGVAGLCLPVLVWAEEKMLTPPDPLASGGRVFMFLLLILALIIVLAWLVHKTRALGGLPGMAGNSQPLRLVATLSLGMKEKIAVVQAGDKQLVVGITARQITLLTELDEPLPETQAAPASFADLLKKAIRS